MWLWLLAHLAGYTAVAAGAAQQGLRVSRRWHARSHSKCIERIARLEMELGIGLDWGREVFANRKPKTAMSGYKRVCWLCEGHYYQEYDSSGPLREHLCGACVRKTKAQLAAL